MEEPLPRDVAQQEVQRQKTLHYDSRVTVVATNRLLSVTFPSNQFSLSRRLAG